MQLTKKQAMETIRKMNITSEEKKALSEKWFKDQNTKFAIYAVWKRQNMHINLLESVREKVGCSSITFSHWQHNSNGSDVPVFNIPEPYRQKALNLSIAIS